MAKKKFEVSNAQRKPLQEAKKLSMERTVHLLAQVSISEGEFSLEIVDWAPAERYPRVHRVDTNKTLVFYSAKSARMWVEASYSPWRTNAMDFLFDQAKHRVAQNDNRAMVFLVDPDNRVCKVEALWTCDKLDEEHVAEVRFIYEQPVGRRE